jgi:flagellar basal-body rod protein FlgB
MAITDIPILSMLRTRMNWHQERQRLLSENIANSDTPNFRPRDLAPPTFARAAIGSSLTLMLARTDAHHLSADGDGGGSAFEPDRGGSFEIRPGGNAVSLEDQMLKVAANQMDYQAATTLYARGLGLIKTALGKS